MGVPKKKAGGKKKPARAPQQLTAEEHFENAEMAFAMENLDLARSNFKRALDMEPDNVEYLEGYGSFLAEVGPRSEALTVLQKAAQLAPDEGFEKYMYLGQLVEGPEAEHCVRKGISILRGHIQRLAAETLPAVPEEESQQVAEVEAAKQHLDTMLASALCSLVEVIMNQAGEKGDAGLAAVAAECEQHLGEARTVAPRSPEPLQALASLRQQQGKEEEALSLLRQSLAMWFKPPPPMSDEEEEGLEEEEEDKEGGAELAGQGAAAAGQVEQPSSGDASKQHNGERQQQGGSGGGGDGGPDVDMDAQGKAEGGEAASDGDDAADELGSAEFDDDDMLFEDDDPAEGLPSYEFRFEAAKLLLELDESVETASQVLEQLLEENDSDPNVWLLLAMCHQGGGDLQGAMAAVEEGLSLCKRLRLPSDDETLGGFEAMQAELQALLESEAKARKAAQGGEKGGNPTAGEGK